MKFLLMFFIAMVVLFQWRQWRKPKVGRSQRKAPPADAPQAIVACAHCGLHVPARDAVAGAHAQYCSTAHLRAREP